MLSSLKRRLHSAIKNTASQKAKNHPGPASTKIPTMQQVRRDYYFDAPRHTAKSLRILINDVRAKVSAPPEEVSRSHAQIQETMRTILHSVNIPELKDAQRQKDCFHDLIRLHFSAMSADELQGLTTALKAINFQCNVEAPRDEEEENSEFNYSPYEGVGDGQDADNRSALKTNELYEIIDELRIDAERRDKAEIDPGTATATRNALGPCAQAWKDSGKSLEDLQKIAVLMGEVLGIEASAFSFVCGKPASPSSLIESNGKTFILSEEVAAELKEEKDGYLFSTVLRDLTEALLTKKLFGPNARPDKLSKSEAATLANSLDRVYSQVPTSPKGQFVDDARDILAKSESFGHIDIAPTAGGNVGHAWISPVLSVSPDMTDKGVVSGKRYMHLGSNPTPHEATIRERPIVFLSDAENELKYARAGDWKLVVPVDKERLLEAAKEVREEWTTLGLPYRFASPGPGSRPTGCRVTVFESVIRAMDVQTRTLFEHFNAGLPEPDSPTELWERLDQFMNWIKVLAES